MTAGLPRSDQSDASLYIINLCSSAAPVALEAPDAPELAGFAVFRSRRVEDGRDRFRLHLGYFDSQEQAEKFLPLVRDRYPAAWVALAPKDGMGSLDDTSVAQFKFIRQRTVPHAATPPPANLAQPPREADSALRERDGECVLQPVDVLSLLESSPRILPGEPASQDAPNSVLIAKANLRNVLDSLGPSSHEEMRARPWETDGQTTAQAGDQTVAKIPGTQRFAVQLMWSTERINAGRVPQLAIFDAYTLYTVTVARAGRRWYGLRLGFFHDPVSARQVTLYARSDFSAAAVVPVSGRECERASRAAEEALRQAAAQRATAPAARAGAWSVQSVQQSPPAPKAQPKKAAAGKARAGAALPSPAPNQRPVRQTKSNKPNQPRRSSAGQTRKRSLSTAELLTELGADEISLEGENHAALNDSGVRHLSVSLVKRKRPLGKLLSRMSGR
jgi:hypothetical protein